jgi:hypothetical protein
MQNAEETEQSRVAVLLIYASKVCMENRGAGGDGRPNGLAVAVRRWLDLFDDVVGECESGHRLLVDEFLSLSVKLAFVDIGIFTDENFEDYELDGSSAMECKDGVVFLLPTMPEDLFS